MPCIWHMGYIVFFFNINDHKFNHTPDPVFWGQNGDQGNARAGHLFKHFIVDFLAELNKCWSPTQPWWSPKVKPHSASIGEASGAAYSAPWRSPPTSTTVTTSSSKTLFSMIATPSLFKLTRSHRLMILQVPHCVMWFAQSETCRSMVISTSWVYIAEYGVGNWCISLWIEPWCVEKKRGATFPWVWHHNQVHQLHKLSHVRILWRLNMDGSADWGWGAGCARGFLW